MTDPEIARRQSAAGQAQTADQPAALNALGVQALAASDPTRAAGLFARAAAADPSAPPLWINLAKAQRQLGDDAGERASLLRALDIDQLNLTALIRLAELHERLGEDAEATARWSGVLVLGRRVDDPAPELRQLLGRAGAFVEARMGLFAAAIERGLADARGGLDRSTTRRFDACVDHALGRRAIYLNQCEGAHYPFLPADEFFDRANFPWMPAVEARTDAIRAELEALLARDDSGFAPYVAMDPGTPVNKWTELDNSLAWSSYYLWRYGAREEEACARCPATAAALDLVPRAEMPRRAPTAFFSILKPRTRIPPHTGVSNVRTIVHLPLIVPPGCGFRVGGETREWRIGEAFAFDDTIEHEAWNDSDALRAVLIFDVWNPHLSAVERDLLRAFFAAADASGHDPGARASV